jgi:carbon starvation protein
LFEALFILSTVDAGTRAARYVLQELMGKAYKPFGNTKSIPGMLIASVLVVISWGYLIYTGSISTIWPLFGVGNQLLATIALAVTTTFLVNNGKQKYAWTTVIPMVFVGVTTLSAAILSITTIFWPLAHVPGSELQGYLDAALMSFFVVGVILVVSAAMCRCWATLHGVPLPVDAFGAEKPAKTTGKIGCC